MQTHNSAKSLDNSHNIYISSILTITDKRQRELVVNINLTSLDSPSISIGRSTRFIDWLIVPLNTTHHTKLAYFTAFKLLHKANKREVNKQSTNQRRLKHF